MTDNGERPGVDRLFKMGDEASDEGLLIQNILMDNTTLDREGVVNVGLMVTNEFQNEETIKFVVREFLVWIANQNRIGREDGQAIDWYAIQVPLEPTNEEIDGLLEGFIETHPFSWLSRSENPMVWKEGGKA